MRIAIDLDRIGAEVAGAARRRPCTVWVVVPSALVAVASAVLWLLSGQPFPLFVAALQPLLLAHAYARARRRHRAYLGALRAMRRSQRRYALVLRSFSERSVHERPFLTFGPGETVLQHVRSLAAPLEALCREAGLHCVVIGGGLTAEGRADDVVIYLDYRGDGWEQPFRRLARGAAAIIVFPETSPALITEIEHLRDAGLLPRTAFVAPPTGEIDVHAVYLDQEHFEGRWIAMQDAFKAIGLDAPPLSPGGSLFKLVPEAGRLRARLSRIVEDSAGGDWTQDARCFLDSARDGEPLGAAMQDPATHGWRVHRFDPLDVPGGDVLLPALLLACFSILFTSMFAVIATLFFFLVGALLG